MPWSCRCAVRPLLNKEPRHTDLSQRRHMATATKESITATPEKRPAKPLPAPNSDFYEFAEMLPAEELAIVKKVRAYMETNVAPIINKYWAEDSFPFEILPA